jgi:hypothetical protein
MPTIALAADQPRSDRQSFRRPLSPPEQKNPALMGVSSRAGYSNDCNAACGKNETTAQLDRQADFWLSVGRVAIAERLSFAAADLRRAVPA